MSKTFRPWVVEQSLLLPLSIHELVPAEHLAHFVRNTVREQLDLSAIFSAYDEERGYPPYHPTTLLLCSRGVYSSRRIAQACEERVDFMAVTAMNQPDFRTIAKFRRRKLAGFERLFRPGAQAVPGGRFGEARACGAGRQQGCGQRQRAQGDVAGWRSRYRLRKQIVEPVFGQIKQVRDFWLLPGLNKIRGEWAMICTVHDLLKPANATG